jgi:hypothetical protein
MGQRCRATKGPRVFEGVASCPCSQLPLLLFLGIILRVPVNYREGVVKALNS